MTYLRIAYALDLLVFLPIAVSTLLRLYPTDKGRFEESAGWWVLEGALWTAILVFSGLGLYAPLRYSLMLFLQVIYKTLWLLVFALLAWSTDAPTASPGELPAPFLLSSWCGPLSFRGVPCFPMNSYMWPTLYSEDPLE